MPKKCFTDEQIAFALRPAEAGTTVGEVCRKMGIAEATFYRRKKVYAGMGVAETPVRASKNGGVTTIGTDHIQPSAARRQPSSLTT